MVKKKVSSVKRSSTHSLKNVIKTKNNNVVVLSTEKKPVVQEIEIKPPVAPQAPTPKPQIIQIKETGNTVLIAQPSNEPTPIFKDDTPKTNIHIESNYRPEKESNLVKNIGIGFFILIGLFWLTVIVLSINISTGPHVIEKNVTAISYVGDKISFGNLTNLTDITYKGNVNVLGYLRKEVVSSGPLNITNTYVVDDYGNRIKLSFKYENISAAYSKLFINNRNTPNTFNVTGTYRFSFTEFILDVSSITAQNKQIHEVRSTIVQNITEGPAAGVKFNIAVGMKKVLNVFK